MEKKTIVSICVVLAIMAMATGTAFGQVSDLSLDPSDIRFEPVYLNDTVLGYSLFVRKRLGMESVMLTEPSGYHALRSIEWNPINGSERRELSGVPLSGAYSRYSILSSIITKGVYFYIHFDYKYAKWVNKACIILYSMCIIKVKLSELS